MCYPDAVTHREELDDQIGRVQALLDDLRSRLSPHWIDSAVELLRNDEPNEALIQLAWGISSDRLTISAAVRGYIQQTVGDPRDLPLDLAEPHGASDHP
jgi:hypothetical protein